MNMTVLLGEGSFFFLQNSLAVALRVHVPLFRQVFFQMVQRRGRSAIDARSSGVSAHQER